MLNDSMLAGPLIATAILLVFIVVKTWAHHPWSRKYGAPIWDYSSSFASNLAAFTGAVNALLATATSASAGDKKLGYLCVAGLFGLVTALAPLVGFAWKVPGNQTYFGGVVASVLVAATGGFGQIQLLIKIISDLSAASRPLGFGYVLYFSGLAIFVYCLFTADLLARTPPATPPAALEDGRVPQIPPQRWAIP